MIAGRCIYNREVDCTDKHCHNCGWNPTVERKRKIETRRRLRDEREKPKEEADA